MTVLVQTNDDTTHVFEKGMPTLDERGNLFLTEEGETEDEIVAIFPAGNWRYMRTDT